MILKWFVKVEAFLILVAALSAAQIPAGFVQVTATVPSLANGAYGASWTNLSSSSQLALLGGLSTFQQTVNGTFDANGSATMLLADTAQIIPSPSTWTFQFTFSCPAGSPSGGFFVAVAVTGGGGTEDISSQIIAALPTTPCGGALPNTYVSKTQTTVQTLAGALAWVGGDTGTPAETTLANLGGISSVSTTTQTISSPLDFTGTVSVGTMTIYGTTSMTIKQMVDELPSTGGTIILPVGTFRSGYECSVPGSCVIEYSTGLLPTYLSKSNVTIIGSGMPSYSSDYSGFVSDSGTIIQGSFYIGDADNFSMSNVGIDVGYTFVNANYGGSADNGLVMFNVNSVVGKTPQNHPVISHVASLILSSSSLYHAVLLNNVNGASVNDLQTVYGTHGFVLKGENSEVSGVYGRGHATECVLVKSDTFAEAFNDTITGIRCDRIVAEDTGSVVNVQSGTYNVEDISFSGAVSQGAGSGIRLDTATGLYNNRVSFSNFSVNNPDTMSGVCLESTGSSGSGTILGATVSNFSCNNYTSPISFTVPTSIAITNFVSTNSSIGAIFYGPYSSISNSSITIISSGAALIASTAGTIVHASNFYTDDSVLYSATGGANILVSPPSNALYFDNSGNMIVGGNLVYGSSGAIVLRGGTGTTSDLAVQNAAGTINNLLVGENGSLVAAGTFTFGGGVSISSSSVLPQVGASTANQATCVKSVGPPVVIGYCSTVVSSSGTCTCN